MSRRKCVYNPESGLYRLKDAFAMPLMLRSAMEKDTLRKTSLLLMNIARLAAVSGIFPIGTFYLSAAGAASALALGPSRRRAKPRARAVGLARVAECGALPTVRFPYSFSSAQLAALVQPHGSLEL